MADTELTASGVISFAQELEDEAKALYECLAVRFPEKADLFLRLARDSDRNKTSIVRTYQETITDALEACFSFGGLQLQDYTADVALTDTEGLGEAIAKALAMEERATRFYHNAAERSGSLLATIPGAFRRVARGRAKRKADLQALLAG